MTKLAMRRRVRRGGAVVGLLTFSLIALEGSAQYGRTAAGSTRRAASHLTGSPKPPNPCVFDAGSSKPNYCRAIVRSADGPMPDELNSAWTHLTERPGNPRKPQGQDGTPLVHTFSRQIYLPDLPDKVGIVVGAITFAKGQAPDSYYGVGDHFPDGRKYRSVFIVASKAMRPAPIPNRRDIVVARWSMYRLIQQTGGKPDAVEYLKSGSVVNCADDTPENDEHPNEEYATFSTCRTAGLVAAVAKKHEGSMTDAMAWLATNRVKRSALSPKLGQRMSILATNSELVKDLKAVPWDDSDSPYWFTCGLGCCTVEII